MKLSLAAIQLIRQPAEIELYKIDELLSDHYTGLVPLNNTDLITLLELKISSQILVSHLRDLCEQAEEAEVSHLHLYPEEVQVIGTLARGLATTSTIKIGNTNLRSH